jgi:hypothetical protein
LYGTFDGQVVSPGTDYATGNNATSLGYAGHGYVANPNANVGGFIENWFNGGGVSGTWRAMGYGVARQGDNGYGTATRYPVHTLFLRVA